jgi:hypothetical protein
VSHRTLARTLITVAALLAALLAGALIPAAARADTDAPPCFPLELVRYDSGADWRPLTIPPPQPCARFYRSEAGGEVVTLEQRTQASARRARVSTRDAGGALLFSMEVRAGVDITRSWPRTVALIEIAEYTDDLLWGVGLWRWPYDGERLYLPALGR